MITSFNGGDAARCGLDRRSIRRAEDGPAPAGPQHSGGRPKPGFLPREEGEGTEPGKKVGDAVAGPADPARTAEREVRSGRQSKCGRSGTVRMKIGRASSRERGGQDV